MTWQLAIVLFAMVSPVIVAMMAVEELTTWRMKMWWWILGIVCVVGFSIWFINGANI